MNKRLIQAGFLLGFALLFSGTICGIAIQYFHPKLKLDLDSTAHFGDSLGGIISPIMNLIGAILVYASFTEQKKANDFQFKELALDRERINALDKFNQITNLMLDLEKLYNRFEIEYTLISDDKVYNAKSEKALNIIYTHFKSLSKKEKPISSFKHDMKVKNSYYIFIKHLAFISTAINEYEYNLDDSKEILKLKFKNIIIDFVAIILKIHKYSIDAKDDRIIRYSKVSQTFIDNLTSFGRIISNDKNS